MKKVFKFVFVLVLILFQHETLCTPEISDRMLFKNLQFYCEEPTVEENEFINPYSFFLDNGKAKFIVTLCKNLEVDSDLVIAILMKENPNLIEDAESKENKNGTHDLGYFQLNDRCLYEEGGFLDLYWDDSFPEFDPYNWMYNSFVAINHIKSLSTQFGDNNYELIAAAYNCGAGRTISGNIPSSTEIYYVPSVLENLGYIQMNSFA